MIVAFVLSHSILFPFLLFPSLFFPFPSCSSSFLSLSSSSLPPSLPPHILFLSECFESTLQTSPLHMKTFSIYFLKSRTFFYITTILLSLPNGFNIDEIFKCIVYFQLLTFSQKFPSYLFLFKSKIQSWKLWLSGIFSLL